MCNSAIIRCQIVTTQMWMNVVMVLILANNGVIILTEHFDACVIVALH